MRRSLRSILALSIPLGLAFGCGSDSTSPGSGNGDHPILVMGLEHQFSVNFSGIPADSVVWGVPGGPDAGSVDQTGLYTAGLVAGDWKVVAVAMYHPEVTDTFSVTVVPYATPTPLGIPAYGVAVNAAGTVAGADNGVAVRFLSGSGTVTATTGNTPVHLAYSPGGATAFVTSMGGKLFRVTAATGAIIDTADFGRSVYNIAIRPTDSTVYVSTVDGWLIKVAPTTLAPIDSVQLASASNGLAFSASGGTLWASTIDAGVVYSIDPATLAKSDSFVVGSGLQRLAVAPSGDSVYVGNQNVNRVYIIRPSTRTVTNSTLPYGPHGIGISSDGTKLFVAQVYGGRVSVLSRATMQLLGVVPVGGNPRNVAAVPGTQDVVVSTQDNVVRIHR